MKRHNENRGQTLINPETLTDKSGLPRTSFEINIYPPSSVIFYEDE